MADTRSMLPRLAARVRNALDQPELQWLCRISSQPAVRVVASIASEWTLGHEVGHVLGLPHVTPTDRLMMGGGGMPPGAMTEPAQGAKSGPMPTGKMR